MLELFGIRILSETEYQEFDNPATIEEQRRKIKELEEQVKLAHYLLTNQLRPPATPTGDVTSGGLEQPTYKELYETEQRRANQAERELDNVMGQLDAAHRENEDLREQLQETRAHIGNLLACSGMKKANALHAQWIEAQGPRDVPAYHYALSE